MKLGAHVRILVATCTVIAGAAVLPATSSANVRSQALYARGLIPYDRGQWEQAYRLFDQAVQADASDAVALYYRGLTQARRGQRPAAIKDVERALQLNPTLPHAALDLGIAYFDEGQYAPAKKWLEVAYQQGVERFTAAFFLGLTCYRTGDDACAEKYLTEAKADPDLRTSAEYYSGLVLLRQGKTDAGRAALQQVAREQPQSEIGKAAQRAVGGTDARQPPTAVPAGREKPWSLYGELGFQYDSNVVLAPNDTGLKVALDTPSESDGRAVIGLGADYWLDTDYGSLRGAYDFYQSVHFQLTEFDLQGHRVRLDAASPPGTLTYGISGIYNFYALDYQTFYQEGLGTPWIAIAEGDAAATQGYYTLRGRDFFREPYDPARDSINNAVGIRQYLDLSSVGAADWLVGVGYQFDFEDTGGSPPNTAARDFQYKGNQADIGLTFPIYTFVHAQLAYLFRLEDYQYTNSRADFQFRRHDNEHQFVVALARDLTSHIRAELDYFGVINNSNIADFDYDRNIVSLSARVTF